MCKWNAVWRLIDKLCRLAAKQLNSLWNQKSAAVCCVGRSDIHLVFSRKLCFNLCLCCWLDIIYGYSVCEFSRTKNQILQK